MASGKIYATKTTTIKKCEYGCNKNANYIFSSGKYCCSIHWNKCPIKIFERVQRNLGKNNPMYNKHHSKITCLNMSKNRSGKNNPMYNKHHSKEIRKIISEKGKGKVPWNKNKKNVYNDETLENMSIGHKITIKQIKEKYPTFVKIEEMRYKPGKEKEKVIQVRCKNHLCLNSKEKDGWFAPTKSQIYERIRTIDRDGSYFYCSQNCKGECPLYGKSPEQILNIGYVKEAIYTQEEYQTWRSTVLKRENYLCEYCDKKATDVHHSRPQKLEPGFVLDPDFGIACCEKHHYKYGHKIGTECSTGKLANKICIKEK